MQQRIFTLIFDQQFIEGRAGAIHLLKLEFQTQRRQDLIDLRVAKLSDTAILQSFQGGTAHECSLCQLGSAQANGFALLCDLFRYVNEKQHDGTVYRGK